MNIRTAYLTEADLLAAIDTAQTFSAHWTLPQWDGELANPASRVWVCEEGPKISGFIVLRLAAGIGEIVNLAVLPEDCRRGIGTALLEAALAAARNEGGEKISLEVHANNLPAQALYRKAGFNEIGIREKFYGGKDDALIMGFAL